MMSLALIVNSMDISREKCRLNETNKPETANGLHKTDQHSKEFTKLKLFRLKLLTLVQLLKF